MTTSLVIKRSFWLSCSITLSVLIFGCGYMFLAQLRASSALNHLKNSKLAELSENKSSINLQERNLSYVQFWFKAKNSLLSIGDTHWIEVSANIFSQLIKNQPIKAPELTSQCTNCSPEIFKSLKLAQQKIIELEAANKRSAYLLELSSKLEIEIVQKIKLHQILAKDFERLVGSPSAYNSNRTANQILYFVSGSFKWLPLLDTSKVDKSLQSEEHGNFAVKLESLRQQSKGIVDNYLALKNKSNETIAEQANLQKVLDNLNNTLSIQLISLWEIYLPLFSK